VNFLPLIESKREGKILVPAQIQKFIREFTAGKICGIKPVAGFGFEAMLET